MSVKVRTSFGCATVKIYEFDITDLITFLYAIQVYVSTASFVRSNEKSNLTVIFCINNKTSMFGQRLESLGTGKYSLYTI